MINASYRTTAEQIDQANASGRTPVVFIHGLWYCQPAGTAGPPFSSRLATLRSRLDGRMILEPSKKRRLIPRCLLIRPLDR